MATTYEDLINKQGTIYNKTTGQGYQTPEQLSTDLGISGAPDWSKITSEDLKQEVPIDVPKQPDDKTNYNEYMNGVLGDNILKNITQTDEVGDLLKGLSGEPKDFSTDYNAASTQLENTLGQDYLAAQKVTKSAQTELSLINAQIQEITDAAKAQNLQLEKQISGGQNLTAGSGDFLNRQQQEVNRQAAIKSLPLQAQALVAQAKVTAAQGNQELAQQALAIAQQKLDKTFELKMDYENRLYDYKKEQRDRIWDYLTKKEQTQLDALQREDDRKYEEFKANQTAMQNLATEAINNGQSNLIQEIMGLDPKATDFQQKLLAVQSKIQIKEEPIKLETIGSASTGYYSFNPITGEKKLIVPPTPEEPTQTETEIKEVNRVKQQLVRGQGGNVDLNEYRRIKSESSLDPNTFDAQFGTMLEVDDQIKEFGLTTQMARTTDDGREL